MRRPSALVAVVTLVAVALVALLVVGLRQAGDSGDSGGAQAAAPRFDLHAAQAKLQRAPAPLGPLYRQGNELLDGGRKAFDARLATLRGHPVVINKWASWCAPCRAEFPIFQQTAVAKGSTVAFLGVNGTDKRPAAERFLAVRPLPFPSYEDPEETIARSLSAPANYPITVFVDARGKTAFIHQGTYRSSAELTRDIARYLDS